MYPNDNDEDDQRRANSQQGQQAAFNVNRQADQMAPPGAATSGPMGTAAGYQAPGGQLGIGAAQPPPSVQATAAGYQPAQRAIPQQQYAQQAAQTLNPDGSLRASAGAQQAPRAAPQPQAQMPQRRAPTGVYGTQAFRPPMRGYGIPAWLRNRAQGQAQGLPFMQQQNLSAMQQMQQGQQQANPADLNRQALFAMLQRGGMR